MQQATTPLTLETLQQANQLDLCAEFACELVVLSLPGEYLGIKQLMFHYTMIRGFVEDKCCIAENWCYTTKQLAVASLVEWSSRGFSGEPIGWHRHPISGRRRTDGDPAKQYIQH